MITKSAKNTRFYKVDPKTELTDQFVVIYKHKPRGRKVKALIIYDSVYGNTKRIAEAIASSISVGVKLLHVNDYKDEELKSINLLIVGSPTIGGRPTQAIQNMIERIPLEALKTIKVTSFDTRMTIVITKLFGWAADRIGEQLFKRGAELIAKPTGFILKGRSGPLAEGEIERATEWGKGIIKE